MTISILTLSICTNKSPSKTFSVCGIKAIVWFLVQSNIYEKGSDTVGKSHVRTYPCLLLGFHRPVFVSEWDEGLLEYPALSPLPFDGNIFSYLLIFSGNYLMTRDNKVPSVIIYCWSTDRRACWMLVIELLHSAYTTLALEGLCTLCRTVCRVFVICFLVTRHHWSLSTCNMFSSFTQHEKRWSSLIFWAVT